MLNKEEIEKSKECLKEIIQNTYAEGKANKLDNLMKYIDQLETNNKNLIEKLENKQMKLLKQMQEPNNDRWEKDDERYYEKIKIQYKSLTEILEIVKGEK